MGLIKVLSSAERIERQLSVIWENFRLLRDFPPFSTGGAGAVSSVFGRDGAVAAAASDYDANQVDYSNTSSGLAATDAQAAIDELVSMTPERIDPAILDYWLPDVPFFVDPRGLSLGGGYHLTGRYRSTSMWATSLTTTMLWQPPRQYSGHTGFTTKARHLRLYGTTVGNTAGATIGGGAPSGTAALVEASDRPWFAWHGSFHTAPAGGTQVAIGAAGCGLLTVTAGNFRLRLITTAGTRDSADFAVALNTFAWWVLMRDTDGDLKLYMDGSLVASTGAADTNDLATAPATWQISQYSEMVWDFMALRTDAAPSAAAQTRMRAYAEDRWGA